VEEEEYSGSDGLEGKYRPNPGLSDDFQFGLKTGCYRFSDMMY